MKQQTQLKLVLVGGGSGGHITPLITLAQYLHRSHPDWQITYVGDRRNKISKELIATDKVPFTVRLIITGKLRRYSDFKGLAKVKLWREYMLNIADFFLIIFGCLQSFILLLTNRPKLVFSKGGMSAFGVCLSALMLRIPVVTHDSDATGSLTHRLVGRYAKLRLTGTPVKSDRGDKKLIHVGIPIDPSFSSPLSRDTLKALRHKYGLHPISKVMLVIGGGQGARSINEAVLTVISDLNLSQNVTILILTGKNNYSATESLLTGSSNAKITVRLIDFATDVPALLQLSDWVITRAGATALAEVAAAKKPVIIIPNPILPASHQVHNANAYHSAGAGLVVDDTGSQVDINGLKQAMESLFNNQKLCAQLSRKIAKLAIYDASARILKALESFVVKDG